MNLILRGGVVKLIFNIIGIFLRMFFRDMVKLIKFI